MNDYKRYVRDESISISANNASDEHIKPIAILRPSRRPMC